MYLDWHITYFNLTFSFDIHFISTLKKLVFVKIALNLIDNRSALRVVEIFHIIKCVRCTKQFFANE